MDICAKLHFVDLAQSRTVAWREIDGIELRAEIFSPARPDPARGLLLWFHGGGLILGGRMDVPDELVDLAGEDGFPLVSVEYRLAPQAGLEDIASDAYAALRWAQTEGSGLLGCDGGQTVVAGLSAGGYPLRSVDYCTSLSPTTATPPPGTSSRSKSARRG